MPSSKEVGVLFRRFAVLFALCCVVFLVSACTDRSAEPPVVVEGYVRVEPDEAAKLFQGMTPGLQGLQSWNDLRPALEDSLGYILRRPKGARCVNRPGLDLKWGELASSVAELIALLPRLDANPELLAERFAWFRMSPETLLTGYYEPWLEASLEPGGEYQYPLYGVPEDLRTVDLGRFHHRWKGQTLVYRVDGDRIEPYFDREGIDGNGALKKQDVEVAWAKDPVDVFFLQIQGSGRLELPGGQVKHILYGGKNGRPYVSLGRVLIERGHIPREEMSMQRIRAFLNANPNVARDLMFENPSYVFFRLSDNGPYGSMSSILTPRVSVAVDRTMAPLGGVMLLQTALLDYDNGGVTPFNSLVLAQDTGGAIKGTRCDFFCGSGREAEFLAGHLQEDARLYMMVSRRVLEAVGK